MLPSFTSRIGFSGSYMSGSSLITSATLFPLAALCVNWTKIIESIINEVMSVMI